MRNLAEDPGYAEQWEQVQELNALYVVGTRPIEELVHHFKRIKVSDGGVQAEQRTHEAPFNPYAARSAPATSPAVQDHAAPLRQTEYPEADWERARHRADIAKRVRADIAFAQQYQHELDEEGVRKRRARDDLVGMTLADPQSANDQDDDERMTRQQRLWDRRHQRRLIYIGESASEEALASVNVEMLHSYHSNLALAKSERAFWRQHARHLANARSSARTGECARRNSGEVRLAKFQQEREDEILANRMQSEEYAVLPDGDADEQIDSDGALARSIQQEDYEVLNSMPSAEARDDGAPSSTAGKTPAGMFRFPEDLQMGSTDPTSPASGYIDEAYATQVKAEEYDADEPSSNLDASAGDAPASAIVYEAHGPDTLSALRQAT